MYPKTSMEHVKKNLQDLLTKNVDKQTSAQSNADSTDGKDRTTWMTVVNYYTCANQAIEDVIRSINRLDTIYGPMLDLISRDDESEEV